MGCDIHAFIDYNDFRTKEGDWYVSCFADRVEFGRNYTLFALMAGVRYDKRIDKDFAPLFEPRGIPDTLSYRTLGAYTLRVADDGGSPDWDGWCSEEDAEKWLSRGHSHRVGDHRISDPDWHSASWLTVEELERVKAIYESIEFPKSSWFQLQPPESQPIPPDAVVIELGRKYGPGSEWYVEVGEKKTYPAPRALDAIIACMKALNRDDPLCSRLVFWFDN